MGVYSTIDCFPAPGAPTTITWKSTIAPLKLVLRCLYLCERVRTAEADIGVFWCARARALCVCVCVAYIERFLDTLSCLVWPLFKMFLNISVCDVCLVPALKKKIKLFLCASVSVSVSVCESVSVSV